MPGRGFEKPFIDLSGATFEILRNFNRIRAMLVVAKIPAIRRVIARMSDRKLKEAARFHNSIAFGHRAICFGHIHQGHERSCKIKTGIGKRQIDCAGDSAATSVGLVPTDRRGDILERWVPDAFAASAGRPERQFDLASADLAAGAARLGLGLLTLCSSPTSTVTGRTS